MKLQSPEVIQHHFHSVLRVKISPGPAWVEEEGVQTPLFNGKVGMNLQEWKELLVIIFADNLLVSIQKSNAKFHILLVNGSNSNSETHPGGCSSLGASSVNPKVSGSISHSVHKPGLWFWSLVGDI